MFARSATSGRAEAIAMWSAFSLVTISTGLLVSLTARLLVVATHRAADRPTGDRGHAVSTTPILGPETGRPYAAAVPAEDRHSPPTGSVRVYPPQ